MNKNKGAIMIADKRMTNKWTRLLVVAALIIFISIPFILNAQKMERRISVSDYRDKMMAGWIGQMVGVGWDAPTEFRYPGVIMPADKVPEWKPEMVKQYNQDDIYVEMTFLRSMEEYGFDVSQNQAGIDFANSAYMLWVANAAGRDNLRNGIAPPNSGHPKFNKAADAIDYQIEADFSGLIAPGLPNTAIALGEKFGRLMNYGDGLYGGQFVGGMYAEAFFEDDPLKIVKSGLRCIPEGSQYAEAIRDVIQWHKENPDDWEATWKLINKKYHENPDYRRFSFSKVGDEFNIDAKLNGAYIVMGLLYGNSDPDLTTVISMRCGQDSDCNPSNAAGILFTTIGFKNLPDRFVSALDNETKFSYTSYTFPALADVCEKLAREAVTRAGGRIETNIDGEEVFVIPVLAAVAGPLEQSHDPGPVSENTFSKAELRKLSGSKLFRYSLLILILLAFIVFKENYKLKALAVFIPVVLLTFVIVFLGPKLLGGKGLEDMIIALQSLAAAMAIFLLAGHKFKESRWFVTIGVSLIILVITGYTGVMGANDGRYVATTKGSLITVAYQSLIWLVAIVVTTLLTRKKYGKIRFNVFFLPGLLLMHTIGMFIFAYVMFGAKADMATLLPWITMAIITSTVVQYLITLPYLILTYTNKIYDQRLRGLLKLTDKK